MAQPMMRTSEQEVQPRCAAFTLQRHIKVRLLVDEPCANVKSMLPAFQLQTSMLQTLPVFDHAGIGVHNPAPMERSSVPVLVIFTLERLFLVPPWFDTSHVVAIGEFLLGARCQVDEINAV